MFGFNKKEEPVIKFVCTVPGLLDVEEVLPKKASSYIPEWWRSTPRKVSLNDGHELVSVKSCPSFTDYFSQGYILPAWSDFNLQYDAADDYWNADFANLKKEYYDWGIHPNPQFLDHVTPMFQGKSPTMVFKGNSPWRILTKPGWSVMQVPLFYHFDNDLTALPGIIDTDIMHEVNIQMLYFGEGKKINVKRGQPLVQYIPFKREDVEIEISYENDFFREKMNSQIAKISTKFLGSGGYRLAQKERDKN